MKKLLIHLLNQQGDDNIATALLKEALGRENHEVYLLLKLTSPKSRAYRDDNSCIDILGDIYMYLQVAHNC